jgi:hypothetical protein
MQREEKNSNPKDWAPKLRQQRPSECVHVHDQTAAPCTNSHWRTIPVRTQNTYIIAYPCVKDKGYSIETPGITEHY